MPFAAAPGHDVEIENAGAPAPTGAPTELAFDGLEVTKHLRRLELAFDECDGICEVASRSSRGSVEEDR